MQRHSIWQDAHPDGRMVGVVLVAAYYGRVTCALWEITHGVKVRTAEVLTKCSWTRAARSFGAYHAAPFNEVICMLMISVDDVMKILKDYMVCDGLYREVDDIEIRCKLNQSAHEVATKAHTEEEWYE